MVSPPPIVLGIEIVFLAFTCLALFFRSWFLRMFVIVVVAITMILKGPTLGEHMRIQVDMEWEAGTSANEYYRGVLPVLYYGQDTEIIPVITSTFLVILCAAGFRNKGQRKRESA